MDASELVFQNESQSNGVKNVPPGFAVQIVDKVEKTGDCTWFYLTVGKYKFGEFQDEKEIKRSMEDFRSLDRRIRADNAENSPGMIVPRLSNKETALIETVPDNNAKFMGKCAAERVMFQRYINAVLLHPLTGRSKIVEDFLSLPDFSSHANYKLSLAKRLTGAVDDFRTSNYLDCDAFLQQRKEKLGPNSGAVSDFHNTFTLQNINKKNLSAVMALLSQSLSSNGHPKDEVTKLLVLATDAIKQEEVCPEPAKIQEKGPLTAFLQYGWHLAYWNGELTLGTYLKHHIAQLDSLKDMFNRRRALLHDLEKAKSAVEHAKPQKKESAQATLTKMEEDVRQHTATAKEEVRRMEETELKGFRQALIDYAESQMQAAQESFEILLEQIRKMQE